MKNSLSLFNVGTFYNRLFKSGPVYGSASNFPNRNSDCLSDLRDAGFMLNVSWFSFFHSFSRDRREKLEFRCTMKGGNAIQAIQGTF